ncbi:aminoacyl-tRNA hydrolase [Mycoplasma sp. P36-A1]|uniref:aminoacyl-tRNA hydrolase n=1 Tax=Mycoplasma sp. P36-A1 TaxID=3252900 RepID=UPI003C2C8A9F
MKLIVGLGNPGKEYENTRHNAGFLVVDSICKKLDISLDKEKFNGLYYQGFVNNEKVIILKPLTYMNLSGECLIKFADYFDINDEDILVIYDDMDTEVGKIRLRAKGSSGGQRGMKNIIQHFKTEQISRIRVGIGKKTIPDVKDYVLSKFREEEIDILSVAINTASDAAIDFCSESFDLVMNKFNNKI